MRVHLAIVFSLVCGPVLADATAAHTPAKSPPSSTGVPPHICLNDYPLVAMEAHAEGTTTLSFTITAIGTVKDVKIAKSSGNQNLDDAAIRCAAHWLYKPAETNFQPVETPWQATVVWKFGEPPSERDARNCLGVQNTAMAIPTGTGITQLTFVVLADGSIKNVELIGSSGNKALDDVGVDCATAGHFDVSLLIVPPGGLPGHVEYDWSATLQSPKFMSSQESAEPAGKNVTASTPPK